MVNYTPDLSKQNKDEEILIKDVMIRSFNKLKPEQEVKDAMELLINKKLSGVVVVGDNGEAAGFLSEKDLLNIAQRVKYYNSEAGKIKDYMSKYLTALTSEDSIYEAIDIFTKYYFHIIPVIDDNVVVGVLDRHTVLKAVEKICQTTW